MPNHPLFHPDAQAVGVPPHTSHPDHEVPHAVGAKETVISLIIAFALAFVFRGYVVEPYVIPTNSMAPTLLGAHIRWVNPANGYDWPTSHFFSGPTGNYPQQGGNYVGQSFGPLVTYDPMSRQPMQFNSGLPLRSGDRIFVLRYVWPLFTPERWDVTVFKTPTPPEGGTPQSTGATQAFIKRLVGLPNEELALFDGDVFTRPNDGAPTPPGGTRWDLPDWKIQAKPELVQRAVWQPIFDSRFAVATDAQGRPFQGPFVGEGPGWEIAGRTSYVYAGTAPTRLLWDMTHDRSIDYAGMLDADQQLVQRFHRARTRWSLTDSYPMDEILPPIVGGRTQRQEFIYPVSDLRLSAGVEPKANGLTFAAVLRTRGHEFRAHASGGKARIEMRPALDGQAPDSGWTTLAQAEAPGTLAPGKVTNIDFWHHDQRLELWIENRRVLTADYDWTLTQRVKQVFGKTVAEALALDNPGSIDPARPGALNPGFFGSPVNYSKPEIWFDLSGPATLHRVAVARDLFYQPILGDVPSRIFRIANGAHPTRALKVLGPDQYFVCGDNSPMSSDARAWTNVDKWVARQIDPTPGVVHKRLIVGKAFFVYFPAVQSREVFGAKIPMVDAGRLRWIW
jgi:signal peptidase I